MQTPTAINIKSQEPAKSRRIKSFSERQSDLNQLKKLLTENEQAIFSALKKDLHKPEIESYAGELAPLYEEIDFALSHLKNWMEDRSVETSFWKVGHWIARSFIRPEPRGRVLILAPWNYPIYLTLSPVVGALAAGNSIVLKPSELSPHCSHLFQTLIGKYFLPEVFDCVSGGVDQARSLMKQKWDLVFFTGGARAAREIYAEAAKSLTPVVLELGGKSPAIFDPQVSFDISVKRLMWGKFFNAGQTCVAPDYALVPRARFPEFLAHAKQAICDFYSHDAKSSPDYARIIDDRHWDRLISYLPGTNMVLGGEADRAQKYISPTLILNPQLSSTLMQEEIFGPLLPILTYDSVENAFEVIESLSHPLALYIFSSDSKFQDMVLNRIPSGGACINDCLVHLTNPNLPFGGVGESGIGAYHGYEGFRTFSHLRAIERKPLWSDISLRYPPYKFKLNRVFKWFI